MEETSLLLFVFLIIIVCLVFLVVINTRRITNLNNKLKHSYEHIDEL